MKEYCERRYSSQDGLSLYYRDYGDRLSGRTPVLCLPGLTRNSKDFHTLARRLSARRRVVCPDYRGRGRSDYDSDWRNYRVETYAGDIRHLLTLTGLHRVALIGTSMGGLLSAAINALAPTAVAGAVLNDVGPEFDPGGLRRIVNYIGTDRPQPDLESAARSLRELLPDLKLADEEAWLNFAASTYREGEDGMYHYDWDLDLAKPLERQDVSQLPDLWPLFRGLGRVPVLAIRGARSDVLSPETFERMGREIAGVARVTVAETGHAPTLSEPEAAEAIDALLARLDGD